MFQVSVHLSLDKTALRATQTEISPLCDRLLPDCQGLTSSSGMYTSECVCADKGATEERGHLRFTGSRDVCLGRMCSSREDASERAGGRDKLFLNSGEIIVSGCKDLFSCVK